MQKSLLAITMAAACMSWAAEWSNEAVAGLNMAQNSNHNWVAGGEDAVAWQTSLQGTNRGDFSRFTWKNELQLAYGRTKIADQGSRKHMDKIFFESLLGYKLLPQFKPYLSGRVETQFTTSYEYSDTTDRVAVSDFWDPGYLTESVGMGWEPGKRFQTRLGFALKQTFADEYDWADDPDTEKRETFRNEPGLESISEFTYAWNEILQYKGRLSAFVNFEGLDAIDGHWENTLNAQVAKYLVFSAGLEMLYDKDLSKDSQLRQGVTVGLTFQMI